MKKLPWVILVFIISFLFLSLIFNGISTISKQLKYRSLSNLSVSVQVNYLKKYLSEPAVVNEIKDKNQKEYIFVDPDYYVFITANNDNKVLSYVVTTRKKDFNSIVGTRGFNVQLGKTSFYNQDSKPVDCELIVGNTAPSHYLEKYMGWNGTTYQDYLFGYNDAGFENREIIWTAQSNEEKYLKNDNSKNKNNTNCYYLTDNERKKYSFNTFGFGSLGALSVGVNRRFMELIN